MPTCEHCQNKLLDHVYGLLEESEIQEMREHLTVCATCQAAQAKAQGQQALLARAAKVIRAVPEFSPPRDVPPTLPQSTPSVAEPSAVLPMTPTPRRPLWRRPWIAWCTAAGLLIAVGAAVSSYRTTLHAYQQELAQRRQDQQMVERLIAALPTKYGTEQHEALHGVRSEMSPYLHVVGPTHLQPGASGVLHVTTRQLEGEPAKSKLNVKLVEAKSQKVVREISADSNGHARLEFSAAAAPPGSDLNIVVEAQAGRGFARVSETIHVDAPTYVTRLDTSKNVCIPHDKLFFRVLVLERSSLRPPSQPIPMRVALVGPDGKTVRQFPMQTGAGGILAGELRIDEKFHPGHYVIEAGASDGRSVQSASQGFNVTGDSNMQTVQLDQYRYKPGETVRGLLQGGVGGGGGLPMLQATATINGQPVPVTVERKAAAPQDGLRAFGANAAVNAPGGAGDKPAARAAVPNLPNVSFLYFSAKIPANVPPGAMNLPLNIQVKEGKAKKEYNAVVPLQPTDFAIDLFPEGGELIAGIPNRVFYRVRSTSGESVTVDGHVILLSKKNEIVDTRYKLGLGYFDFTPQPKESYSLRITTPGKTQEIANPFAAVGMRSSGMVLHVPGAVGNQGEPIHLTLRNQGPPRKILLIAQCRGQVVEQRWIDAKTGARDFTLETSADAHGMIRVTACEFGNNALEPIAERLVYRRPRERLDLGVAFNMQQRLPGQTLSAKLSAKSENGKSEPAWLLAALVDERFQAPPRSLSAHFLLLNEVRTGADLDDAQLILNDSPQSAPMLELFLGTHGWRRFAGKDRSVVPPGTGADSALVFSRENMPLETLQKQYDDKLALTLDPIHKAAIREHVELDDQHQSAVQAVHWAARQLQTIEVGMQVWVRLGLGLLVAVLLVVSLVLMFIGTYRILRQHKIATPAFGSAFAGLVACLAIMFASYYLGPIESSTIVPPERVPVAWDIQRDLERLFSMAAPARKTRDAAPVGALALRDAHKDSRREIASSLASATKAAKQAQGNRLDMTALREQSAFQDFDRGAGMARMAEMQKRALANLPQEFRTENAKADAARGVGGKGAADKKKAALSPAAPAAGIGSLSPAAAPARMAKKAVEHETPAQGTGRAREYAYQYAPNLSADTLLWSPSLWLVDGSATVRFDIAAGQASYRILLLGHTPTGRFGFLESRLDVPAIGR